MKKLYVLAFSALFAGGAMAQVPINPNAPQAKPQSFEQNEVPRSNHSSQLMNQNTQRAVLYYEDFSNGFEGTIGMGEWLPEDSGIDDMPIWMEATGDSPAGQFSTNAGPLMSTTADNGWVIFDADYYQTVVNDTEGTGVAEDLSGTLRSPELDFSDEASVIVTWEQYFRYCCYSPSPFTLEVSVDGGDTWAVFPAHGNFIENANQQSANPLTTTVDISCAAAGESSVYIRFGYDTDIEAPAYSHYFWGIDDVTIESNETGNDLRITQITNGDVFDIYEYYVTPLEQAIPAEDGGMVAGVMYANEGYLDQTNVEITVTILDEGGTEVHEYTSSAFDVFTPANHPDCPSPVQDTMYLETGFVPEEAGVYTLSITIESDQTDASPDNNTMQKEIVYTENPGQYGHDHVPLLDGETTPRESEEDADLWEPDGWGNSFTFVNDNVTVWGTSVRFGAGTDPDAFYQAHLTHWSPADGINNAPTNTVIAQTDGEVAAWMIPNSIEDSEAVWLLFDDETDDIIEGEFYFMSIFNSNASAQALTFYGMLDSDTDFSSGSIDQSGAGDFIWFLSRTFTPAIRLITDEFVSVDEISTQNGFHMGQNHPNPANASSTRIPFSLDKASDVRFEIYDISGKLVKTIDQGQMAAGNQFIDIDISSLNAGVYSYSMIVNDQFSSTKKMVIQ